MKIVPTEKIRKDLILGLIYPAVLGNIIYLLIRVIFEQANIGLGDSYHWDGLQALKIVLLVITLAFYFCDYLYITFTNDFEKVFFLFDVLFIIVLFWTIYLINIDDKGLQPNARLILFSYFLFMSLYLVWDIYEESRCTNESELKLYQKIIRWEKWSMRGLALCFFLTFFSQLEFYINKSFFAPLAVVTIFFGKYTYEKRKYYRMPEYKDEQPDINKDNNISNNQNTPGKSLEPTTS